MARNADVITLLERIYRTEEKDDVAWLRTVSEAAAPVVGEGIATAAYHFEVVDGHVQVNARWFPSNVDAEKISLYVATVPPEYVRSSWLGVTSACASAIPGFEGPISDGLFAVCGARDVMAMCGAEPSGRGVWLGTLLPKKTVLTKERRVVLDRLAVHLASAHRVRRELDRARSLVDQADAILDPSGKTSHAVGDAKEKEARDELRRAVRRIDRVRATKRTDSEGATRAWKALVSMRWSLLDHFESDGKRYIVARRNVPRLPVQNELSEREHQVIAFMALGHSTKVVAYELGLSDATVRVLLHRAMRKLRVTTRADAIAKYRRRHEM